MFNVLTGDVFKPVSDENLRHRRDFPSMLTLEVELGIWSNLSLESSAANTHTPSNTYRDLAVSCMLPAVQIR